MSATHHSGRGLAPRARRAGLAPLLFTAIGCVLPAAAVAQEAIEAELGAPGFMRRLSAGLMRTLADLTPADESLGRTQAMLAQNQELIERLDRRAVLAAECLPGGNDLVRVSYCPPDRPSSECTRIAYSCAPMRCVDGRCGPPSCVSNADCGTRGICNTTTGACVGLAFDGVCIGDFTVSGAGAESSCAPYKCQAGLCRSECITTTDCASDYECCGQKCVRAGQCR